MSVPVSSVSLRAKIREVGVHSVIYGFGSVAQSAVQFLLIPVLTASFSTSQFGAYSLIQMAAVVAGSVFYLGMTSALPRSYFDYEDERERRSVTTTAFLLLASGAVAQVVVGHAGSSFISRLLLQDETFAVAVRWAFLGSALAFVNQFFFTYLRFQRRSVASIVLSLVALVGSITLSLYFLSNGSDEIAAPFKGIASAQAAVAVAFVAVYGRHAFSWSIRKDEVTVLMRFGVPTVLTSIAVMIIDWADRILIERMISVEEVGVYSVGYRLGSIVNVLVITPFTQIWNPMMLEYRAHQNIGEFFSRVVSYYFLASSVILVASCLFTRNLLPIVARSADYHDAAPVVLLVMAGYLTYGATNIVAAGLIYERRIFVFAAIYYAAAAVKTALNAAIIPVLGMVGAAAVTLIVYIAIPLAVYARARRHFAIRFERWRLARILWISGAALIFGLVVDPELATPLSARLVLFGLAVAALAYFCTESSERSAVLRRWS